MKFKKSPKKIKRKRKKVSRSKYIARRYLKIFVALLKALLIVGLCGLAGYLILFSSLFRIENIIVEGTREYVNPHDVTLLAENNIKGENIFKFEKESLAEKLESNLLGAKKYEIKKEYPGTIRITVFERVPIAMIYKDMDEF
ncbi:cell division protein FtsQ/DivIB, partial [Patescibacteria group bacterium]